MTLAGILWPIPGQVAQHWGLSRWVVSSIFLISGLTLQDGEFAKAVEAWPLGLFGLASILLFTPMAAYILLQIRLSPPELVTGLAIFCCVPTTISSGVSLTQLVGGNATLALALTVISNLFGIFTMPVMLSMLFSHGIGVSIPVQPLLSSLLQALLLPLFIGKGIRTSSLAVKSFVDRRRHKFSMLTSALLSLVPWMQISSSINVLLQTKVASLVMSFSLGLFLHILFLAWNSIAMKIICRYLGNKDGDKTSTRAIILVASQKTLPVTVAVVENIGGALGAAGLLVLPCVAAHLTQILIDALLVNIWLQQDRNQGSDLVTNHTHKHSS
ncbi:hypothetical protein O6H91_11G028100 [Diphasiastrum complanatum]|nr:hypothetical protein O6H91_11G028100 [Diphasiastrum complanatum]